MARIFFDIIHDTGLTRDEERQELSDLPAAPVVALEGRRSMLRDEVAAGFVDLAGHIEISDADRRSRIQIPFGDAAELRGIGRLRPTT